MNNTLYIIFNFGCFVHRLYKVLMFTFNYDLPKCSHNQHQLIKNVNFEVNITVREFLSQKIVL